MPLQIRRGTYSELQAITPAEGEPVYALDTQQLFLGDGITAGGHDVANPANQTLNTTSSVQFAALRVTGYSTLTNATVTNTLEVATIKFADGSTQTTADTANPNQSLNTNSNVTFTGLRINGYSTLTNATVTNILEVATIRFADGSTQTTADTANPNQTLNTSSDVTFNSVQIGGNSGNKIRLANNAVYVDSTTSVVVTAPNGFAIDGSAPGNASLSVDQIQSRVANASITVLNTTTFQKPVNIQGRVQVGPGNDIGYVSSNGAYNLKLTTNDTQGPGNEIQLVHGVGSSITFLQREGGYRTIASLGTGTSNFYSNSVQFLDQDSNGLLTFDSNGSTHYGNFHNFGNSNQNAQINSQGTGDLKLVSGSDANDSGFVRVTKTDVRLGGPTSLDMVTVNTSGVTISTTATINGLKIGYNNGEITIPNVTADADNMWLRTTGNNGAIMLTCLTSAGVKRNFAWANGRLRFDLSQAIYPNPADGAMTIQGGTTGGVDGLVTVKDWSGNNDLLIDPATGVRLLSTSTITLSVNDLSNPGVDVIVANTSSLTVNVPVSSVNSATFSGVVANTGTFIDSTIQNLTANSTATIQGLKIGYNDGAISIPNVTADADNMWIRTTGNSGSIIMTCKTSAGVDRNFAWANSRLRFDSSQVIYPNPANGNMSVNGGTVGGVDGVVNFQDYSGNNSIVIDPSFGVNIQTTATYNWTFGLEGLATLPVLSAAPATPTIGMLGVADGVTWDPAGYSTTTAYVTFYNGTAWTALG